MFHCNSKGVDAQASQECLIATFKFVRQARACWQQLDDVIKGARFILANRSHDMNDLVQGLIKVWFQCQIWMIRSLIALLLQLICKVRGVRRVPHVV